MEHISNKIDSQIINAYNLTRVTQKRDSFCFAPFVGMNFEAGGYATPCSYNRAINFGSFPEVTIEEMWKSKRKEKLKNCLRKNDLSYGCGMCQYLLHTGNFYNMQTRFFDYFADNLSDDSLTGKLSRFIRGKAAHETMPQVFTFELSNKCNLQCIMCHGYWSSTVRRDREKKISIAPPYDAYFVEQLESFLPTLKEIKFLGGEPFLIDIYYDIWQRIARVKPEIDLHITTNGTVLNQRVKNVLSRIKSSITISLDSMDKENYENIRVNAVFDKVMKNVEWFIDYTRANNGSISIAVCAMQQNWQQLPELVKFCNSKRIYIFFNCVVFPNVSLSSFPPQKIQEIIQFLHVNKQPVSDPISQCNNVAYESFLKELEYWLNPGTREVAVLENTINNFWKIQKKLKHETTN